MFWQDLDPGYYENPAAYTYLLYGLLRVMYGPLGFIFDLPFGNVTEQFSKDPTQIWVAARTLAAVLCMVGVVATYWAARRLWGAREGLVAAAVLSFAFLPVAYSRVAVTDVGALTAWRCALRRGAGPRGRPRCATTRSRARPPAWPTPSSTRPGSRCCRSRSPPSRGCGPTALRAVAGLAARRRGRRGGVRGPQPVRGRLVRRLVERPARPGRGGLGPAQAGPGGRRRRPTTSTASPGGSAGPPRWPRSRAPRSSCAATSCAG